MFFLGDASQTAIVDPTIQPFATTILNSGGIGLLLLLVLTGRLMVRSAFDELKADRAAWKTAYETERDARTQEHSTLELLVEQGKLSYKVLEDIQADARIRFNQGRDQK